MSTNNKQIIKISPEQVIKQILANSRLSNINNAPLIDQNLKTVPPLLEKTCGLFNSDELDKSISESDQTIDDFNFLIFDDIIKMDNELFEECEPLTDYLINNFGSNEYDWSYDSSDAMNQQLNSLTRPLKEKSKFAMKLENANLHIEISQPSQLCNKNLIADLSNPIVNEADFSSLITPGVEKTFNQILNSIPTSELLCEPTEEPLMLFDPKNEHDWNHVVEDMVTQTMHSNDHSYIKPNSVFDLDNEEDFTNDSMTSAFTENTLESNNNSTLSVIAAPLKKKRPRGVYRKDDVRNEEDLKNYIQRRKKNNMSSKVSRANKKAAYQEIDSKIDFLFNSNEKMNNKIQKLEKINKIIKDMLVDRLAKSANT